MKRVRFSVPKYVWILSVSVALVGCDTMMENPGLSATGAGLVTALGCSAAGGNDKACIAGGIVAGAATYGYLQHQLKKLQALENVDANPCTAKKQGNEAYCLTIAEPGIRFDSGSAAIKPESLTTLNDVASIINEASNTLVYIEGHTDSDGSANVNQTLSEKRAQSVQSLFYNQGIGLDRMQALGYGESKLIYDDQVDATKKPLNRRVEIRVEGGES